MVNIFLNVLFSQRRCFRNKAIYTVISAKEIAIHIKIDIGFLRLRQPIKLLMYFHRLAN